MQDLTVGSQSPFNQLPAELLARIFEFTVENQVPRSSFWDTIDEKVEADQSVLRPAKQRRPDSLLVAAVCQRWRSISFSEPCLWSHMHLMFRALLDDGSEDRLLQQWLHRTGSLPLSISITHYPYTIRSHREYYYSRDRLKRTFESLSETISRYASRIHYLYLVCTCKWGTHHFSFGQMIDRFLTCGMQVSALEGFQHTCHPRSVHHQFNPVLQLLTSGGEHHDQSKVQGYRALKNISLGGRVSELYVLLTFFPSLENIDFIIVRHDWSGTDGTERPYLHLPYLKRLRVAYPSLPECCSLRWDKLHLPNLQVLSLVMHETQHSMSTDTVSWPMFHSCIKLSRPPLVSLAVNIPGAITDTDFIDLLSWVPTLRRLYVRSHRLHNQISDKFWSALTQNEPGHNPISLKGTSDEMFSSLSTSVCPRLNMLSIDTPSKHNITEVANALISRILGRASKHGGFLKRIKIDHCDFNQEDFNCYPGIQQCWEAGAVMEVNQWAPGRPPFPPNRRQRAVNPVDILALDIGDLDLDNLGIGHTDVYL